MENLVRITGNFMPAERIYRFSAMFALQLSDPPVTYMKLTQCFTYSSVRFQTNDLKRKKLRVLFAYVLVFCV